MKSLITIALAIPFALGADAALCFAFSVARPPIHMGLFIGPALHAKFLAEERIAFAERFAILIGGLVINGSALGVILGALRRRRGERGRRHLPAGSPL
jgi:hypothetical protein